MIIEGTRTCVLIRAVAAKDRVANSCCIATIDVDTAACSSLVRFEQATCCRWATTCGANSTTGVAGRVIAEDTICEDRTISTVVQRDASTSVNRGVADEQAFNELGTVLGTEVTDRSTEASGRVVPEDAVSESHLAKRGVQNEGSAIST